MRAMLVTLRASWSHYPTGGLGGLVTEGDRSWGNGAGLALRQSAGAIWRAALGNRGKRAGCVGLYAVEEPRNLDGGGGRGERGGPLRPGPTAFAVTGAALDSA